MEHGVRERRKLRRERDIDDTAGQYGKDDWAEVEEVSDPQFSISDDAGRGTRIYVRAPTPVPRSTPVAAQKSWIPGWEGRERTGQAPGPGRHSECPLARGTPRARMV